MAITDIQAISNKEHDAASFLKSGKTSNSDSGDDFFAQLQQADSKVENEETKQAQTPTKAQASAQDEAKADSELKQDATASQPQSDPQQANGDEQSADAMLAYINASHNIGMQVTATDTNTEFNTKFSAAVNDKGNVQAPRPIDRVTPIIDMPVTDEQLASAEVGTMPSPLKEMAKVVSPIKQDQGIINNPPDHQHPPVIDLPASKVAEAVAESTNANSTDKAGFAGTVNPSKEGSTDKQAQLTTSPSTKESVDESVNANKLAKGEGESKSDVAAASTDSSKRTAQLTSPQFDKLIEQLQTKSLSVAQVVKELGLSEQQSKQLTEQLNNLLAQNKELVTKGEVSNLANTAAIKSVMMPYVSATSVNASTTNMNNVNVSNQAATKLADTANSTASVNMENTSVKNTDEPTVTNDTKVNFTATNKALIEKQLAALTSSERKDLAQQINQYLSAEKLPSAQAKQLSELASQLQQSVQNTQASTSSTANSAVNTPVQPQQLTNQNVGKETKPSESSAKTTEISSTQLATKAADIVETEAALLTQALVKEPSPKVMQLFTQLTNTTTSAASSYQTSAYEQADTAHQQALQTQDVVTSQTSATAQTRTFTVDAGMMQALNIIKSDAAKMLQERVSAMLNINNKEADIRLDPPEMGSMQIRIRSDAEQAQINFVVQNQQAKEALEQSMPRLREMLAQQGIELGESSIQQGNGGQEGDAEQQQFAGGQDPQQQQINEQTVSDEESSRQQSSSSIDYYA